MDMFLVSGTESIFTNRRMKKTDVRFREMHVARGGVVFCQAVLRSLEDFSIQEVQAEGWPYHFQWMHVNTVQFNDGIPYPDPLGRPEEKKVMAHSTACVCLIFQAPEKAEAADYPVQLKITGENCEEMAWVNVQVHAVTMPKPRDAVLMHEYFIQPLSDFPMGEEDYTPPCEPFYRGRRYSPEWWDLMEEMARYMKGMRVNVLWMQMLPLLMDGGSRKTGEGQWTLDFTRVKQYIDCFLAHGSFRYISVTIGVKNVTGGYVHSLDENGQPMDIPTNSPEAETWLTFYVKSIYEWFEKQGLLSMLQFHLQDEPHASKDWLWAREICRKYAPGITCGEPLDTYEVATELAGACDRYVPRLEIYEQGADFFRKRQAAGDEVWTYSCCFPEEEEYMNRFIDRPVSQSRLMYWACFSQNITGFLHWGFSYWNSQSIHGMTPAARFKGDGYVVYPDVEHNSWLPSMRYMASLMGAEEYELLALAAKKHPKEAQALAIAMARDFQNFETDSGRMEAIRARLFTLCEME